MHGFVHAMWGVRVLEGHLVAVCPTERQRRTCRKREREKFIDNQVDDRRSVTPLQGDTAAGHSWPSIGSEYYTPILCSALWHAFSNTQEGPNRCRSAPITDSLFRGFGILNRSPAPLVQRAVRDHPCPIFAGSPWREGDLARRVRHG